MPPSLESLSVELLDRILSFVQPRSCLFHLALVSRNFNTLVTPHLYRDVFLESNYPSDGNRHILPFTLLMLLKPSTASLVRSFTFRGDFHNEESLLADIDDNKARLPWPDHPERDNILKRLIKEISHSPEEEFEWQQQVLPRYSHQDTAIYPLLLISLPNLRRLDLQVGIFVDDFFERTFNRIAPSEPPFDVKPVFTQLSDILLVGSDHMYPTPYILFEACCRLPAVKRLFGYRLGNEDDDPRLVPSKSATSSIQTSEQDSKPNPGEPSAPLRKLGSGIEVLELRDSKLHYSDLPIIFGALMSPHTLIYHIGGYWGLTSIQTPAILSAITIHATSLHRLAIDHEEYPFNTGVGDNEIADPISFAGFAALSHLRVAPVFLFGYEDLHNAPEPGSVAETAMVNRFLGAFPPNLENLCITNAEFVFNMEHAHIAQAFKVLLRQKNCVPHLRELVFEGEFEQNESIGCAGEVIKIAGDVGVNARAKARIFNGYCKQRGWGWDEDVGFEAIMHSPEMVQVWPKL